MYVAEWVVTIVLKGNQYIHATFESDDEARAAHKDLFQKLNDTHGTAQQPFAEVGNHVVRLSEVQRVEVSTADMAPGYSIGFG